MIQKGALAAPAMRESLQPSGGQTIDRVMWSGQYTKKMRWMEVENSQGLHQALFSGGRPHARTLNPDE